VVFLGPVSIKLAGLFLFVTGNTCEEILIFLRLKINWRMRLRLLSYPN